MVKTKTQQAQFAWVPVTTQVRGQDWITLQRRAGKMTMSEITKFFFKEFLKVFFSYPQISINPNPSVKQAALHTVQPSVKAGKNLKSVLDSSDLSWKKLQKYF